MSASKLGFPEVPRSITNPNVMRDDAMDVVDPLSFLNFIKIITTSFQPDTLQQYYVEYLSKWNKKKGSTTVDNTNTIVEKYRDFIKEISLDYTTNEEKKFLSKLNFNDPLDLEIAIPFFSKKLIEISKYFNEKREDSKFEIFRIKTRGSNFGLRREILELSLNYLSDIQDKDLKFNYDDIINNIEIEIEELYDTYPTYLNQTPNVSKYDNKDLDYGVDIFLKDNPTLISEVFYNLSENIKNLKEVDDLLNNKRKLTKKYISSNFYYLSTGNTVTDFVSGIAFEADDPVSNFINRDYPTTASSESDNFKGPSELGFFKPHKTSIVLVDGDRGSFYFNLSNLEPNKNYYFPDPHLFGSSDHIITFIVDDTKLKTNSSSGIAKDLPTTNQSDSKFYGYSSSIEIEDYKYLDTIFESGYIQDSKNDIYGNLYGLFNNDNNFRKSISNNQEKSVKSLLVDGHKFYDDVFDEGLSFDYSVEDYSTFEYIKRSGITTNTDGFSALSGYYTMFGRFFSPYQDLNYKNDDNTTYHLYEGGFLLDGDVPYVDSISSDLSAFPGGGYYYYDTLIEGGVSDVSSQQRALLDPSFPSLTGNMLENVRSNGLSSFSIDCKTLNTPFVWETVESGIYIDDVYDTTQYNLSSFTTESYFQRLDLNGVLYVRNQSTKLTNTVVNSFPYLIDSVTGSVFSELSSSIKNFDIVNDVIFIETSNYLVIFKISFNGSEFTDPRSRVYTYPKNLNPFNLITNRYKIKNDVFFSITNNDNNPIISGEFGISLYKLDLNTFKIDKFDHSVSFQDQSASIVNMDAPCLSYNSRPNIMSVSFLVKDISNLFEITELDFNMKDYSILRYNRFTT